MDLDLVEVAPMANPPVCRIMDYGKFRYEEAQKAKESRRKSIAVSIKEVKFRPKIGRGDFDVKVRKVDEFIREGHKVKVTLQFRGREMAHPELGTKILDQVIEVVGPVVKVETQARLEGRNMSMVLAPDRKALDDEAKAISEAAAGNGDTAEVVTAEVVDEVVAAEVGRGRGRHGRTGAEQPHLQRLIHSSSQFRPPDRLLFEGQRHAKDEDLKDRGQAVQDHRQRPAAARAVDAPAPVREEAVDPHPAPGRRRRRRPG